MPYITRSGVVQHKKTAFRQFIEVLLAIWAAIAGFFLTLTSRDAFSTTLENRHKKRDTPYRLGGGPRIAGLDKLGGGGGKNAPPPCAGGG